MEKVDRIVLLKLGGLVNMHGGQPKSLPRDKHLNSRVTSEMSERPFMRRPG